MSSLKRRGRLRRTVLIAGWLATCSISAHSACAETLGEAAAAAYQDAPSLKSGRANLRSIDEGLVQSRAGYGPQIGLSGQAGYNRNQTSFGSSATTEGVTLSASQPLYTGGRTQSAVSAAYSDILQSREQLRQAEADFLVSVVQAYVDVRNNEADFKIASDLIELVNNQLKEVQARTTEGDLTRTDVAEAQSRLASAQAERAQAQGQLDISRATFISIVGHPAVNLTDPPDLPGFASMDEAVSAGRTNSPALLASKHANDSAAAQVAAARAEHRPTVSIQASLGYQNDVNPFLPRKFEDVSAAGVAVSVPLFSAGLTQSRVRQQNEKQLSAASAVDDADRAVVRRIQQAWAQFQAARSMAAVGQQQLTQAQEAYKGMQIESREGLRSTIDTLNAARELRSAQTQLGAARRDAYVAQAQLLAATGQLDIGVLSPQAVAYDPSGNLGKVYKSGVAPWTPAIAALDSIGAPAVPVLPSSSGAEPSASPAAGPHAVLQPASTPPPAATPPPSAPRPTAVAPLSSEASPETGVVASSVSRDAVLRPSIPVETPQVASVPVDSRPAMTMPSPTKPAAVDLVRSIPAAPAPYVTAPSGQAAAQVGAFDSASLAQAMLEKVSDRWAPMVQGRSTLVQPTDGPKGKMYRALFVGYPSAGEAKKLCDQLTKAGVACFVRSSLPK
jgi:outer membrane protein